MQEVKKRFSKWLEEYTSNEEAPEYVNDCKSKSSKIDKIRLLQDLAAIEVHCSDPLEALISGSKFIVGPNITQFYERCIQEIEKEKRGETPDPYYLLSESLLDKINKHYRFDLNNFEITQAEINQLFEQYHLKISEALEHNEGKPSIILLGEFHGGLSLLQDLMVFEILKDKEKKGTKCLKNLFIELDSEFYKKIKESKSIYKENDLAGDFGDSFRFLTHLALSYGIQVIPVENSLARNIFARWNSSITMSIRDHYMASNITKTPVTSENDISIVLCGASHINGLKSRLEKAGHYILDLDVRKFQIKSETGIAKVMVFEKDNRDIHFQVLLAKQAFMEKTGYFNTLPVEVIDTSELRRETTDDKKQSQVSSPPHVQPLSQNPSTSMPPQSPSDIQKPVETKSLGTDVVQPLQISKDRAGDSGSYSAAPLITSHGLLRRAKSMPILSIPTESSEIIQEPVRSESFST